MHWKFHPAVLISAFVAGTIFAQNVRPAEPTAVRPRPERAVSASAAQSTCAAFGTIPINNNYYIFQNNEWNSSLQQCATVNGANFSLTTANFNLPTNGAPATYPSIFYGCHWGNCTTGGTLPIQESALTAASATVGITQPSGYNNDSAFDIWFNQTATTAGQPNGTEVMIWIDHQGSPQPFGSQVGTVTIDGASWAVWTGRQSSWNIVSYVQNTPTTSVTNLNLLPFFSYATTLSVNGSQVLAPSWYLIDIEFGFEIWSGGQGLAVNNFSVSASSGAVAGAPSITSISPASGTAGTFVTLTGANFGASQGTSAVSFGGTAAAVNSWSNTSITVTEPSLSTGPVSITVSVGGVSSNAASFTVTNSVSNAPSITTVNPVSGAAGSPVTLSGANFGASQGSSTVSFGGAQAAVGSWSNTSITATVPSLTAGAVNVIVSVGGTSSNSASFTVTTTCGSGGSGAGAGYWHTSGSKILDSNGNTVRIAGVNWYGFETPDFIAHGLWAQDYKTVLNDIKSLGYNLIRLPFSNQLVESNPVPTNFTSYANGAPANTALAGATALSGYGHDHQLRRFHWPASDSR